MVEGVKIGKRSAENMKDDDELEMLLGEIPHATSSLDFHPTHSKTQPHLSNLVDHGHASRATQSLSGHTYGHGLVHGVSDDEFLKHKHACSSSPVSGFSLPSDGSSSSLFSGGRLSFSDIGSISPPQFEELRAPLISGNGLWLDLNRASDSHFFDDSSLSRNFSKMYISGERENVSVSPKDIQSCDQRVDGSAQMNFDYSASGYYRKGFSDCGGFSRPLSMETQHDPRIANFLESRYSPHRSHGLFSNPDFNNSAMSPQYLRANMLANNNCPLGFTPSDVWASLNRPFVGNTFSHASRNGMNMIEHRAASYSDSANVVGLQRLVPHYHEESLLRYGPRSPSGSNTEPSRIRVPRAIDETFGKEDTVIIQGEGIINGMNRGCVNLRGHELKGVCHDNVAWKSHERRSNVDGRSRFPTAQDSCRNPKTYYPLSLPSKCSSLMEVQGHIYHIAKDQNGCRFLQRMFDEGTSRDVQIIFNEIIDHVVELMMNPFGNYLIQKMLEVCTEDQRMHILLRVTAEPGELVRISLNTHGTRVVQKLIETLKTRHQILLVIAALEPGFLSLIKDLNGNHVVQRCLQCFSSEDSKFIFIAAAKYCVEIATHQHGCCVLQRCISHSTGEHRENLIAEISANGLLLAQDAFGNYVVQFILELKFPSATSKLTSQFEGNYIHLSTQKFSSHVVEKCLMVCNDEDRSKIIHELLSATYFEQLLQDPHANYVVQTALRVSEGPLHDSLVDAIESYKAISRNSPYSKRIFSHKLLKR